MFELEKWRYQNGCYWWQRKLLDNPYPTSLVEGLPGEGKTLYTTSELLNAHRAGYRVACNYTVKDKETGFVPERFDSFLTMFEICVDALEREESLICGIAEIHLWCNSRAFKETPAWWIALMSLRRHFGMSMMGDTQDMQRVDVVLRDLSDQLIRIRKPPIIGLCETVSKRHIPIRRIGTLHPSEVDRETVYDEVGDSRLYVMPWWAYSYDTREMVRPEPWESSDVMQRRVDRLTARADAAVRPTHLSSFADAMGEITDVVEKAQRDGVSGAQASEAVSEAVEEVSRPSGAA